MADKTAPKKADDTSKNDSGDATNEAPQRKRRMLRATSTEPTTLREQSELAQAKAIKPRNNRIARILSTPFRILGRFIARLFRPLGRFRAVRALGYVFAPPHIRNSWKELKQVTWPDRTQTRRLTFAVVLFSLVFGTIVAGVDFGLDKLFRTFILNK